MPKTVLVPVDDSSATERAVSWAINNILDGKDKLSLLCVRNLLSDPFAVEATKTPVPEGYEDSEDYKVAVAACQSTLKAYKEAAGKLGVPASQVITAQVSPQGGASGVGESIVQYVDKTHQDIVVMGSRGMGAMKRAMMGMLGLGSVSDWVVNHAHCPVVVVKPPAAAAPKAAK